MTRQSRISMFSIAFLISLTLQPSFLLLTADAASQRADLKGFATFKVVDANGKLIGTATSHDTLGVMAFRIGGQVFSVIVQGDGFEKNGQFFFESPDTTCSGIPLIDVNQNDFLTPVIIAPPGSTVYAPDPQAVAQTITVGSALTAEGSCFSFGGWTASVVPVVALVDLDTVFTPPFTVKP